MLNIEKLKELKQQVFDDFQLYEVKMQNSFEESMREVTPTGEMDEAGNDLTSLIDAEIARQSVKSEEVAEAIDILQVIRPSEKEIKSGEYPEVAGAIDLAITAMQDYQPWIPVSNVKPESGKHVLLCCEIKPLGKRYVCDGYYAQSKTITTICDDDNNYEYDEETDEYYLIEGYYEIIKNCDDYSSIAIEDFVTHWKPLPEPPKGE